MSITQYNSSVRQMSQSKFNSMKNASGKIPDLANQIVMTNSEDTNISCLRTEVVYDMTSSDASKNWGYPNGIQGNNTSVGGKDFSRYSALIITAKQGVASMTSIMDLTTLNTSSNTYNSGALGCESVDTDYCKFTVNASKTEFTCNRIGYRNSSGGIVDMKNENAICMKIIGILKTPAMIYTGDELIAGNGISIANGVISADNDANFVIYNLFNDAEKSVTSGAEIIYSVGKQLKKGKYYACVYGQVYMNTRMGFLQLTIDSQTNVVEAATNSVSRIGIYGSNIVTLDNDGEHAIYLKLTAQSNSTITLQGYSTYGFALFRIGD